MLGRFIWACLMAALCFLVGAGFGYLLDPALWVYSGLGCAAGAFFTGLILGSPWDDL